MASTMKTHARSDLTGPVRTCIGCRERATKSELLRMTAGSDEHGRAVVVPDSEAVRPGRGAHLHPTTECYELAVRRKAFGRALRDTRGPDPTPVREYVESLVHTDPVIHRPGTGAGSS